MWTLFSRARKTVWSGESSSPAIELLEARKLLSASSSVMKPDYIRADVTASASTTANTTIEGYTPSQIETAYDLNGLTLSNGVSGTGAGQTIAIVDAYNDPNIASDLAVFDTEFSLSAPPTFSVVNQTGGSKLPADDADWDSEISLDVEWAHAVAPDAKILLVETSSDNTDDLLAGVNYARSAPGVSVVSMSWGGSEFFDFGSGGEFESETQYDTDFTTPAGHQGVTFIAAAGDSGSQDGVEWPAVSPNVVSVGGTSLYTSDDTGTYEGETGWSGTSGGYSVVESEPTYQDVVQTGGARSSPDVAYDGDPDTGVAVYDSVADEGYSGWEEVGGTSAGAPAWAGIVAIADQSRVAAGNGTLDGATQTLPTLYSLYTTTDDDYADNFNDVTSGGGGTTHFRFGGTGGRGDNAGPGYDLVTGLGSPRGASLISELAGSTVTGTTGTTSGSGSGASTGSGTTTTETLPASQVVVTVSDPAMNAITGSSATALLRLTNSENVSFSGPVSITLYASTDGTVSSSAIELSQTSLAKLGLKGFGAKTIKVKFTYPTDAAAGSYYLVASFTATDAGTAASVAQSATPVSLQAAYADLAVSFADGSPLVLKDKGTDSVIVEITNRGNVTASGTYAVALDAADAAGLVDEPLATFSSKRITLKAGKSTKVKLSFAAPAGESELVATLTPAITQGDGSTSDNQTKADILFG